MAGTPWAMIIGQGVKDTISVFNSYNNAMSQRQALAFQGSNYDYQANVADLNADMAMAQFYDAHKAGEWRAMQQGLQDAQRISHERAAIGSSGVRLNDGSMAEREASARMAARLNWIANHRATTEAAGNAYMNAANYRAQATVARGNAEASRIMSKATKPWLSAALSLGNVLFGAVSNFSAGGAGFANNSNAANIAGQWWGGQTAASQTYAGPLITSRRGGVV